MESTVRNLANVAENTAAAAGDYGPGATQRRTANLTKARFFNRATTSVLAQANAQRRRCWLCFSNAFAELRAYEATGTRWSERPPRFSR